MRLAGIVGMLLLAAACGGSAGDGSGGGDDDDGTGDGSGDGSADTDGGADCVAPDVLILLDRTQSMHRRPDGTVPTLDTLDESKWSIAIAAVESLTGALDGTIRFGLALFPRDPGGDVCVTLAERVSGTEATNPDCQAGEIVTEPADATGAAIAGALDPDTTLLCNTTPIGAGLETAGEELARVREPDREQFVLFVGDGQDTCNDAAVIDAAQALARDGVRTYVVSFDGSSDGIDGATLNDMACAGRTAAGFPAPCTADASGDYVAANPAGPALYLQAENAAELDDVLENISTALCCGCVE